MNTIVPSEDEVRVLLVDDQLMIIESIRRILSNEADIQFYGCSDPQKALAIANEVKPTVILQDLVMPDVDGLMLVKFFRNNLNTKHVPIIMLSTREEASIKAEAFAVGANDYLVKLPDPVELCARVRYHSTAYQNFLKGFQFEKTLADNKELEKRVAERTDELNKIVEDLKHAQVNLVQNEKMSSLGQLVAGIAHEINNPVNFIYGNLSPTQDYIQDLVDLIQLFLKYLPEPPIEIQEKIEEIDLTFILEDLPRILQSMQIGSERIRDIVLSLRNFSRLDEAVMKAVDIHDGLESTLMILQSRLKSQKDRIGIDVIKEYGNLPKIECHAGQLNQVFMNLLSNAIDALEEAIAAQPELKPQIIIRTELCDGNHLKIYVIDNGIGMGAQAKEKLFDPFFTTKAIGKGTGLGLSISHQIIVEKHDGTLECQSNFGEGTTFIITLPIRHILT